MTQQVTFTIAVDDLVVERILHQFQTTIAKAINEATRSTQAADAVSAAAEPDNQLLWDVRQVAKTLGISPRHVARLVEFGEMPKPVHLGNLVRWNVDVVRQWITAGCPSQDQQQ